MVETGDKHKDFGILLERSLLLKSSEEVIWMAEQDSELLNAVYKEVSEKLGILNSWLYKELYSWHENKTYVLSQEARKLLFGISLNV